MEVSENVMNVFASINPKPIKRTNSHEQKSREEIASSTRLRVRRLDSDRGVDMDSLVTEFQILREKIDKTDKEIY
jgi:hypothetical protein